MRVLLGVTFLALVAALPTVNAQEPVDQCKRQCDPKASDVNVPPTRTSGHVNVIMYAHYEDILQMAPLNVIPPDPRHEPDLGGGFLMPVIDTRTGLGCGPPINNCLDVHFINNAFRWRFCPGPIEFLADGWRYECHGGQMGAPMELSKPTIPVYFYMSAQSVPAGPTQVGVMPAVGLYARLYTGLPIMPDVVAESPRSGVTGSTTMVNMPGQPSVYELRVEMVVRQPKIPVIPMDEGAPGFTVDVAPYQIRTDQAEAAQANWRVHTGARFPPRLVLPVLDPLVAEKSTVTVEQGNLRFQTAVRSAFGAYDVNTTTAQIRVWSDQELPASNIVEFDMRRSIDHDGVSKPVKFVYDVEPKARDNYTFEFRVRNLQDTFEVVERATFDYTELNGKSGLLPATGLFGVVIAALSTALLRRRSP